MLAEKIKVIYPDLSDSDFLDNIVLQNDGNGARISRWAVPGKSQPTAQQLANTVATEIDTAVRNAKDRAAAAAAKADIKLAAIADMTPTQVRAWVAANVNNLADAKDAIATLAVAVSVLARRL